MPPRATSRQDLKVEFKWKKYFNSTISVQNGVVARTKLIREKLNSSSSEAASNGKPQIINETIVVIEVGPRSFSRPDKDNVNHML